MSDNNKRNLKNTGQNRRRYLKMLGGVTASGFFAGCSNSGGGQATESTSSGSQNPGTATSNKNGFPDLDGHSVHFITVSATESIKDLWTNVTSEFEDTTGATVELEFIETSNNSRITQLIQAGDPPEVTQQGTGATNIFRNQGVLEPLDSVYEDAINRLGEPTDTVQSITTVDGHSWIVPMFHNINMYSYRSDLTDIVPDTWEKALEYARVVDQQDNDVRGTYVPESSGIPGAVRLVSWLWTNEGSISQWKNDEVDINFNEEPYRGRMIELLNFLKDRKQYSPPGEGAGWGDIMNIIQSGRAASSWYGGVRQKNAAIRNDRPFAKDVKLVPGMPVKKADVTDGSTEGLIAFEGADTKAAKAFIRFVIRKDFLVNLLTQLSPIHNVPSWPGVKESDAYLNGIKSLDLWSGWSEEQFNIYQDDALSEMQDKRQETSPPNPFSATYRSPPIWNLQLEVLTNGKDPGAILDKHARELQKQVDEAQN